MEETCGLLARLPHKVCWQGLLARLPRLFTGMLASLGAGPSSQSPSCSCTLCCPRLHAVCRFESERHWFHTHTHTHTDNLWRGLTLFVVPLCSLSFPPSAPLLATSASTGQTSARAMRGKHAWSSFLFASCLPHASHQRLCHERLCDPLFASSARVIPVHEHLCGLCGATTVHQR